MSSTSNNNNRFTLVELMVVVGIILILVSLLLPALKYAEDTAVTVQCMKNLKQIGLAMFSFTADNDNNYPDACTSDGTGTWYTTWDDYLGNGHDGRKLSSSQMSSRGLLKSNPADSFAANAIYACPAETNWLTVNNYLRSYRINRAGGNGISGPGWFVNTYKVPQPSRVFMIVEGREGDGGRLGYTLSWKDSPYKQENGSDGYYPPLHLSESRWNYLYCDGHTETLNPRATLGIGGIWNSSLTSAKGPWTIDPND